LHAANAEPARIGASPQWSGTTSKARLWSSPLCASNSRSRSTASSLRGETS
jgi:hypothetical protein